ncbi:MAG: aspartate carbamoyltransferase [Alphaproteobacteria bacterium]|nr:aspartate carbamoyltransferase [Alphaproteobacteria bacterium]
MNLRHLCSINDLTTKEMFEIMDMAAEFKKDIETNQQTAPILSRRLIGMLFFEASTRTQQSFSAAAERLGAITRDPPFKIKKDKDGDDNTSLSKGESFYDSVMTMAGYCDALVIRTPWEGSQLAMSERSKIPIINAGDGRNQHPTQTLLDLFSIRETQGRLEDLSITIVGDLKYGRTVHSLVHAMANFNTRFNFVSPDILKLPDEYKKFLTTRKLKFIETDNMELAIQGADIVYMTRIQKERFGDIMEYEKVKNSYILESSALAGTKDNLKILHPMPIVNEIKYEVDDTPKAYYFDQSRNGMFVRMAILSRLLNVK